ncbi:MAG: winged helix DNA-binding domain-containing protein [Nocardioidaceae bacterium]|nr:winged helix DNA-binding domain-containing protein [Nocardioidaceae bacterium]MCL2612872.1 winged helix DNA-binding domain-containing protein [Nocardioidaceae bacterium]
MQHVDDDQRRARLARRHHLARRAGSVEEASAAITAWHATEAATVHLALGARVGGLRLADVDRALYDDRDIVKQLAMRRTLFAFPRDLLPAVMGSAAPRVAGQQRALMVKDLLALDIADPQGWIDATADAVLGVLADGEPRSTAQLRALLPELESRVVRGSPGRKWSGTFPIASRVLTLLGAEGRVTRGPNAGGWRLNRPTWTTAEAWLGERPEPLPEAEAYAELVRRWLRAFGPGTEDDLVWWLGATKGVVRRALGEVGAVEVSLDGGATGLLLPDDLDPVDPVEPWAALLPALDPTVMGWKHRGFFLDPADAPYLFDRNGNAGTTAWWDGRVVGCWVQDGDGAVRVALRCDVSTEAHAALDAEAARLTAWLDGERVSNIYASPDMRAARDAE